ncbi:MAG: DNA-3-methyladenine glycosylase [Longimicrobiales bacterium]
MLPWVTGAPPDASAPPLRGRSVAEIARALLGARVVSTVGGGAVEVVVVEVEAYGGPEDPASHAAVKAGRTPRNAAMFGPSGRAYVYRSYGVHWCINVVTGERGSPQAVLLRGGAVVSGRDVASCRRKGRAPLAAGPGRLAQALGVDGSLDGHDLDRHPLRLLPGWSVPEGRIGSTGRVGVNRAAEWPLRFYVRGAEGVTPGAPTDPPPSESA